MVKTAKSRRGRVRTRRTRRQRGGDVERVKAVLEASAAADLTMDKITITRPTSKFVVATYWWGENNVNRNLQYPCPETIMDQAKSEVASRYANRLPPTLIRTYKLLEDARAGGKVLSDEYETLRATAHTIWKKWQESLFKEDVPKAQLADRAKALWEERKVKAPREAALAAERAGRAVTKGEPNSEELTAAAEQKANLAMRASERKFPEMIEEWEDYCKKAGVNYVALKTEFERSDYQHGINAKPLFIKKLLDVLSTADPASPKGVLYIDGDMWVHKYPTLFDMEDVDFMARSWNIDSRTKTGPLGKPFYDPMIFETSGGTMYFGNTVGARRLLDIWAAASEEPKQAGKADDRILSQVFTTNSMVLSTNIIGLPIEYLWLTDFYVEFADKLKSIGKTSIENALIEHPYCLTGEERASEQGAAASRTPENYVAQMESAITFNRPTELIYEYIMFNGHKEMREEMAPYLSFLSVTNGIYTGKPMVKLIPFDERYGEFTPVATTNLAGVSDAQTPPTGATVSITTGSVNEILKALRAGNNVWTGEGEAPVRSSPDIQVYGTDGSTRDDNADEYTRFIQVDASAPMFLSCTSPILQHLLAMSATLADMNTHLKKNYTFLSRIRWELAKSGAAEAPEAEAPSGVNTICAVEFPKIVHQIWFGGGDPGWRETLFAKNKAVAEKYGYTYKLWKEQDRTPEFFPYTHAYQQTAIEKGKETGQSRWAQVADLARLELVYNGGGIYADSIIELSPALFMAIERAVKQNYQFIGCNEDPCDPFGGDDVCKGAGDRPFLTNSFFAATRANPMFLRLLDDSVLDLVDLDDENINQTTGPYFLRSMIEDPEEDRVFMLKQPQMFQYRTQATQNLPVAIDRFISAIEVPGSVKVKDGQYFVPGGVDVLQREFLGLPEGQALTDEKYKQVVEREGPLAIYHSGLGGTWSV